MKDARMICSELCEVSRLALYLAYCGRKAGLHNKPLFSRTPLLMPQGNVLKEPATVYEGRRPESVIGDQ